MASFALRFVGQEALPSRLSEFDREQFFQLTPADVAAITEQFRGGHRLPVALMVLFMRASGRPLDGFNIVPRNLLRNTARQLGILAPSIATLRSIYKRSQTLLTQFRGHPILTEEGVRYACIEASVPGGIPPTDGRTGPSWPHALATRT